MISRSISSGSENKCNERLSFGTPRATEEGEEEEERVGMARGGRAGDIVVVEVVDNVVDNGDESSGENDDNDEDGDNEDGDNDDDDADGDDGRKVDSDGRDRREGNESNDEVEHDDKSVGRINTVSASPGDGVCDWESGACGSWAV